MIGLLLALQAIPIGVWDGWGTFRDGERCWAMSAAAGQRKSDAFASVTQWRTSGAKDQLQVRLSRERKPDAAVVLAVGNRRFRLAPRGRDAWAPDADTDRAILSALRRARAMAVESRDTAGRRFVDGYALGGAPTAIDAARIACR